MAAFGVASVSWEPLAAPSDGATPWVRSTVNDARVAQNHFVPQNSGPTRPIKFLRDRIEVKDDKRIFVVDGTNDDVDADVAERPPSGQQLTISHLSSG